MLVNATFSQRLARCTVLLEEYRGVGLKALFVIIFCVVASTHPRDVKAVYVLYLASDPRHRARVKKYVRRTQHKKEHPMILFFQRETTNDVCPTASSSKLFKLARVGRAAPVCVILLFNTRD